MGAKKSMEFVGKTEKYIIYGLMERDKRDIDAEAVFKKLMLKPIKLIQEDNKRLEHKRNELKKCFDDLKEQVPELVESEAESEKSGSEDEMMDDSEFDGGEEEEEDEPEEKEPEKIAPGQPPQQNNRPHSVMETDE